MTDEPKTEAPETPVESPAPAEAVETEGEALPEGEPKQSEQAERFATYAKPEDVLESMKFRSIPFDRRKVTRVVKDFELDGVTYAAGTVFDWVALKMKPYFVNRLYNRKVLRHTVQDARTTYPFRDVRNDAPAAPVEEVAVTTEQTQDAPAAPEIPAEAPVITEAPKFNKKNAHKRQ